MKLHRGNFQSNLEFLESLPSFQKPERVLEIGSGRGALTNELCKKGHNVVGTEVNKEYRIYAKEEYGIDLVQISAESPKLPFENESFDTVLSFDVFEHIPDTDAHLQEVRRVLKSGGQYILGTPNKWTNIPFEILKEKSFTKYREYHCSLHTFWQMKRRFQKNGFVIEFTKVPIETPFFLEKMKKYFGPFGIPLVKIFRPNSWPMWMRTNFYIVARKKA